MLELAAHALHPAAAVHADQGRERARALRQLKVAGKRNAVMRAIGHVRPGFEITGFFGRIHLLVPLH
jgi:hypothetical protein